MKKNKILFFILLFLFIFAVAYLVLVVDPFQLNLLKDGTSVQEPLPEDEEPSGTGIVRKDFDGQALPYESSAITNVLDFVDSPMVLNREESLERIKMLSETYPEMLTVYNNQDQYADNILIALANNPEMLEFALNYHNESQGIYGFFTMQELESDYPLFLQWDFRWGYMQYGTDGTMGTSGCGPSALAMAVFYLTRNEEVTPDAVAQYSLDHNYYVNGIGTSWKFIDHYPTLFDLEVSHIYAHEPYFKAELDKGNILICSVKPGAFTYGGHFIVIYGYDENGFKVNDPKCAYRSTLTWSFDEFKSDIRRTWSIGNPQ